MITDTKELTIREKKVTVMGEKLGSHRYLFTGICEGHVRQVDVVLGDDKRNVENHTVENLQKGIDSARSKAAEQAVFAAEHKAIESQVD